MGSIFTSRTERTIPIPGQDGQTVTIRALSGRQCEAAKVASQTAAIDALKAMGGAAFQQDLATLGDPVTTAALVAKAAADPLTSYDRYVVLQRGVIGWTYDEPVTPAALDELGDEAVDTIARAILALTLPSQDAVEKKTG